MSILLNSTMLHTVQSSIYKKIRSTGISSIEFLLCYDHGRILSLQLKWLMSMMEQQESTLLLKKVHLNTKHPEQEMEQGEHHFHKNLWRFVRTILVNYSTEATLRICDQTSETATNQGAWKERETFLCVFFFKPERRQGGNVCKTHGQTRQHLISGCQGYIHQSHNNFMNLSY